MRGPPTNRSKPTMPKVTSVDELPESEKDSEERPPWRTDWPKTRDPEKNT